MYFCYVFIKNIIQKVIFIYTNSFYFCPRFRCGRMHPTGGPTMRKKMSPTNTKMEPSRVFFFWHNTSQMEPKMAAAQASWRPQCVKVCINHTFYLLHFTINVMRHTCGRGSRPSKPVLAILSWIVLQK